MVRVENFGFFFAFSMRHVFGILYLFPAVPRSVYGASPYSIGGQIVFHGPFDPNSEGYPSDAKFSTLVNPFGCLFRQVKDFPHDKICNRIWAMIILLTLATGKTDA
jgi:hypothetical protein